MLLAAGMGAHAATAAANREATALDGAPTSLAQAIATAERQTGGHAYDAGVDLAGGRTRIIVETNGPQGVQTVTLDARSGQVVGTHAGAEPD
jgi:uncharacterized membrane protein YkoI